MARGAYFDPDVDPALLRALETVGNSYKKNRVELFSGRAARSKNPSSYHPKGGAIDVNLYDPETNERLSNFQDPKSAAAYQAYANEVYKWAQENDPELAKQLRWGGYFGGGKWSRDWMHFDTGGADKTAGGDWQSGFDPAYVKEAGLASAGGLGQMAQQMTEQGYSREQILDALANIESRGSGDYGALGPRNKDEGDQALGRYQIMQSNLAPWAKQYLNRDDVTRDTFMADPKLQDELAGTVMEDYVKKYGVRGAYSKWFTGSETEPERTDSLGRLTGKTYADSAEEYLKKSGQAGGGYLTGTNYDTSTGTQGSGSPAAATPEKDKGFFAKHMDLNKFADGFKPLPPVAATPTGIGDLAKPTLAPTTPTIIGGADQEKEMRRQNLAAIMARLNSGKLSA